MRFPVLIALLLFGFTTMAAKEDPGDSTLNGDITPAVVAALRTGNSNALAVYFAPTIDLTIPGSEGNYSKSQAELIVRFFQCK
jgi:hypothetical protein